MDSDMLLEEQTAKKGRHRKKQLYNSIMMQMEFYFSDSNLAKDKFLYPLAENEEGVDVSVFLKFNKIRKLTNNTSDIVKAINNSEFLELSEDKTKIKRKTPLNIKEDVDKCTLYVERIKMDATHESLAAVFSEFGNVTYVAIPKYKHNRVNKGFAFVEFEKEQEATEALKFFESIGCKMSLLTPPEELCSIATYEGDKETNGNNDEMEKIEYDNFKKRKLCDDDEEENKKKFKVEEANGVDKAIPILEDCEGKKKKKKIKKKIYAELGLQVLSKAEWKKIRNRYLDNQKAKMKQLKQFLAKKRLSKPVEVKSKEKEERHLEEIEFAPGVIVKIQLNEPHLNLKSVKEDLKQHCAAIKYVDLIPESSEGYLRFSDSSSAEAFCVSEYNGRATILSGKEEEEYWKRIAEQRTTKYKKTQKRGREKLLKKAEKELGKHIKFDDAD